MNSLDFLSNSPTTFIFKKKSNKTNLGGVLTLLLSIIIFIIGITYLYDYKVNPNYVFSYTYDRINDIDKNGNSDINKRNKRENDTNMNPNLKIQLLLHDDQAKIINTSNFVLMDKKLNILTDFNRRVSNSTIIIVYKCQNESYCEIREEDKSNNNFYQLMLAYNGSILDHQNSKSPIKETNLHHVFHFVFDDQIKISYLN